MKSWFVEEFIDEQTIAFSEYGHFERVHSYLFIGKEKSLLIDTGLGIENLHNIITKHVDLDDLYVTATHVHWDHIGGHRHFRNIFVNENEYSWLTGDFPLPLELVKGNFTSDCFASGMVPPGFAVDLYKIFVTDRANSIGDGHQFNLGNRVIRAIHLPGHSPGHMCFFENATGFLVTGDNIYNGTIYVNFPSTDPQKYYDSIDTMNRLLPSINRLLPAHNDLNISIDLIADMRSLLETLRIGGLLKHGTGLVETKTISILL